MDQHVHLYSRTILLLLRVLASNKADMIISSNELKIPARVLPHNICFFLWGECFKGVSFVCFVCLIVFCLSLFCFCFVLFGFLEGGIATALNYKILVYK